VDTTDSEAEDYAREKRKRKRVCNSSSESSDAADLSPPFKRPLSMEITAARSASASKPTKSASGSGSKSLGEATKRRLEYQDVSVSNEVSGTSNHLSSPPTSSPASDAALPMAGIVTISLTFFPSFPS